jgi:hypothetical protein
MSRCPTSATGLAGWLAWLIGAVLAGKDALDADQFDLDGKLSQIGADRSETLSAGVESRHR